MSCRKKMMTKMDPNFHINFTEEEKAQSRKGCEIEEVFEEIPSWFLQNHHEAVIDGKIPKPPYRMLNARDAWNDAIQKTKFPCLWADHVGHIIGPADSQILVAEPYREQLDDEAMVSLRIFCETFNFEFKIDEFSWHYPLRTCRIIFLRRLRGEG